METMQILLNHSSTKNDLFYLQNSRSFEYFFVDTTILYHHQRVALYLDTYLFFTVVKS